MTTESTKFKAKGYLGWVLSCVCHVLIIILLFPIFEHTYRNELAHMNVRTEPAVIEIDVLPDLIAYKPDTRAPETKLPDIQQNPAPDADGTVKVVETSISGVPQHDETKSTEPIRYEQILSRHILNSVPASTGKIRENAIVDIWIKIDKDGVIVDHGFLTDLYDQNLQNIIEQGLIAASPVPVPSETEFRKDYNQYMIPLLLIK